MSTGARDRAASTFLRLVLQHQPEVSGLAIDVGGGVDADVLLAALAAHGRPLARAWFDAIVATCPEQRFAMSPDGQRIRASQGHSVAVELGDAPSEPPAILFHGTVRGVLPAILEGGLRPMRRHHVHLSPEREAVCRVSPDELADEQVEIAARR